MKPAPTRLRLVLWALHEGQAEFTESPPPGLVTIPSVKSAPSGYHRMSGYRQAGERAIRIDMLERLADQLRVEDSRGGFEAKPDMLSITGMTLEQFADLMQGLGYKAERGEREKVKPDPAPEAKEEAATTAPATDAPAGDDTPETTPDGASDPAAQASPETANEESPEGEESREDDGPEQEVFYTFTWARKPRGERPLGKPRGKPKGKPRSKGPRDNTPKTYQSRPAKKDKIDPDNPFAAALMGLKDKG